jgi:hypothetical protein
MTRYKERLRPRAFGDLRSIIQADSELFEPAAKLLEGDPAARAYYESYLSRHPEKRVTASGGDIFRPYYVRGMAAAGRPEPWEVALVITDLIVYEATPEWQHGTVREQARNLAQAIHSFGGRLPHKHLPRGWWSSSVCILAGLACSRLGQVELSAHSAAIISKLVAQRCLAEKPYSASRGAELVFRSLERARYPSARALERRLAADDAPQVGDPVRARIPVVDDLAK